MWNIITAILGPVSEVLKELIPDEDKRREIEGAIQKALIDQQTQILEATKEVMVADANQDDKFVKRARPMVVYWSMGFTTLIALASLVGYATPIVEALQKVPDALWYLMTAGVGIFGFSRGLEKGINMIGKK